jgi:uncharacterized protein involved in exopolysaccharide biosynthesis
MTETTHRPVVAYRDDNDFSLLSLGSVLIRRRRTILVAALVGGILGLASSFISPRKYVSTSVFIPQGADAGASSGLALAASQLGIRVPATGGVWGPPVYVELIRTRALLEPIALDTIEVAELGRKRVPVADLFGVEAPDPARRAALAVNALRANIAANEVKPLGAVKVSVTTRWPTASLALAERLVRAINQFNLETRKSQATAERQFVDAQAAVAERALREAEDRLQAFLQQNRTFGGSPALAFTHNRLEREVSLRQQEYSSLLVNREEARIREVRDTPVITVIEPPRLPLTAESRRSAQRTVLGAVCGIMLAVVLVLLTNGIARAKGESSEAAREFFESLAEATPRWLRRGAR